MKPVKDICLFEHGNLRHFPHLQELEAFLDDIWNSRKDTPLAYPDSASKEDRVDPDLASRQRFLSLFYRDDKIKARNYVGVIRFKNTVIHLLPKVFQKPGEATPDARERDMINAHLLWWLSYCSKFKFPKSFASFNPVRTDFFEVMIYLFAVYTREVLSRSVYQYYQELERELSFVKGRLNLPVYVRENLTAGRWHRVACTYESFDLDNLFNRIVKYVAKLLYGVSRSPINKQYLQEILFSLQEVSDQRVTLQDCRRVQLNPLFRDLFPILDYCRLFLSNSTVLSYKNELDVYAFLLPMEYVFEDFLFGFIKKHLGDCFKEISSQKSNRSLATLWEDGVEVGPVFQMIHDIYLENRHGHKTILDTKYKITYATPGAGDGDADRKHGVSQSDMYQMAAYAIRRGCRDLHLVYPLSAGATPPAKSVAFEVTDEFSLQRIRIQVQHLTIIDPGVAERLTGARDLQQLFQPLEKQLAARLRAVLGMEEDKNGVF